MKRAPHPAAPRRRARQDQDVVKVLDALRERYESHRVRAEHRGHPRRPWEAVLTICFEENTSHGTRRRNVEVTAHDLSRSGFSFLFSGYVHPGTTVRLHFDDLAESPEITGVTCNCIHIRGRTHRVGVRFIQRQKADG